jgi:hypothetical protein
LAIVSRQKNNWQSKPGSDEHTLVRLNWLTKPLAATKLKADAAKFIALIAIVWPVLERNNLCDDRSRFVVLWIQMILSGANFFE